MGKHIKSIRIQNFRGIKEADILQLSRINLIIGKFGSGKSTILEAVSACDVKEGHESRLTETLFHHRGQGRQNEFRDIYHGYSTNNDTLITLNLPVSPLILQIRFNNQTKRATTYWNYKGNDIGNLTYEGIRPAGTSVWNSHPQRSEIPTIILLDKSHLDNLQSTEIQLNSFKNEDLDREFLSLLRSLFDEITDYQTVPRTTGGNPIRFQMPEGRIHSEYLADGMKKVISLLSRIWQMKNAIVLIEELETHLYPGLLPRLTHLLNKLSVENNLQFIITTHSPDLVHCFAQVTQDLKIYHIARTGGIMNVHSTDWNDIELIKDMGWSVGNFAKGMQTYIFVEGETDRRVMNEAIVKQKQTQPSALLLEVMDIGNKSDLRSFVANMRFIVPFLKLQKRFFVLRDLDSNSEEQVIQSISDAIVANLTAQGWTRKGMDSKFKKGEDILTFEKSQIIAVGDAQPGKLHCLDDFTTQILTTEPELFEQIPHGNLTKEEALKNPLFAEQLIRKCQTLPDGLRQIISKITTSQPEV